MSTMPPCLAVYSMQENGSNDVVVGSCPWLRQQLCRRNSDNPPLLVIDTRSQDDYDMSHVRTAINVTLPASTLMMRRLAHGKLGLQTLVRPHSSCRTFVDDCKTHTVIIYDQNDQTNDVTNGICARLRQDGCNVVILKGGFETFFREYPEWCEINESSESEDDASMLGFKNLTITCTDDGDSEDSVDSGHDSGEFSPNDSQFPVEILPYLFLGNSKNSSDLQALDKHNIRSILNVTPNLPNLFEKDVERDIKYMQIPIQDHWSQDLSSFFPQAISFIDDARQRKIGVLVHCLAGVSRSVTITVAYLMQKRNMTMNEAYDFVRQRKTNISPNFSFMGQLLEFERELGVKCSSSTSSSSGSTLTLPTELPKPSPDCGIEMDGWR